MGRAFIFNGSRWCSNCHQHQPLEGGRYVTTNHGRNQRWRCLTCDVRVKAAREEREREQNEELKKLFEVKSKS